MKSTLKKVYVQNTDGSVFQNRFLSKTSYLILDIDTKSHKLWSTFFDVRENLNSSDSQLMSFSKKFLNKIK